LNPTPKKGAAPLPCPASGKDRLRALLEAALFAAPKPLRLSALLRDLGPLGRIPGGTAGRVGGRTGPQEPRGRQLRLVTGGYQSITKAEHPAEWQELLADLPGPTPLSLAAIKTAAAIALQQPITASRSPSRPPHPPQRHHPDSIKEKLIVPAGRAPTRSAIGQRKELEGEFGLNSLEELRSASALIHQPERAVTAESTKEDDASSHK
jgi:chromosome segregation and condensation protein ScpB